MSTTVPTAQHKLCMIPGPIEFHEDVLASASTPATSHLDPVFVNVFGECLEMLRKVVFTKTAQPIVLSGSGTLGWDSVICNLTERDDRILQVNTGYFGDRFGDCATAYGRQVTQLMPEGVGQVPSFEKLSELLQNHRFKLINITHVDTSTGVLTNVKKLAEIIRQHDKNVLISVDGVCSIGAEELRMDEWDIDTIMTASQKALGAPSGLCVLFASERALKALDERSTPVDNYFANWKHWLPIMRGYEARKPGYFATPSVNLIFALHTSLKQIIRDGMEKRFAVHKNASSKVKERLQAYGLKLVPQSQDCAANTMTAIFYPEGIAPTDFLPKMSSKGVMVAGGLYRDIATKYFRIGHMGLSVAESERGHIERVLEAVESAFKELGFDG